MDYTAQHGAEKRTREATFFASFKTGVSILNIALSLIIMDSRVNFLPYVNFAVSHVMSFSMITNRISRTIRNDHNKMMKTATFYIRTNLQTFSTLNRMFQPLFTIIQLNYTLMRIVIFIDK